MRKAVGAAGMALLALTACRGDRVTAASETLLSRWHLVTADGRSLPFYVGDYTDGNLGVCSMTLDSLRYEFTTAGMTESSWARDACLLTPTSTDTVRRVDTVTASFTYVHHGSTLVLSWWAGSDTASVSQQDGALMLSFLYGDSVTQVDVYRR